MEQKRSISPHLAIEQGASDVRRCEGAHSKCKHIETLAGLIMDD